MLLIFMSELRRMFWLIYSVNKNIFESSKKPQFLYELRLFLAKKSIEIPAENYLK